MVEEARKTKTKKKQPNQHNNKKDDENFIVDTIDDSKLQDVMRENNGSLNFKETNSDKNVQRHLELDRCLISVRFLRLYNDYIGDKRRNIHLQK